MCNIFFFVIVLICIKDLKIHITFLSSLQVKNMKNCLGQIINIQLSPCFKKTYKLPTNRVEMERMKTFYDEKETVGSKFASKLSVTLLNTRHFYKIKVFHALNWVVYRK